MEKKPVELEFEGEMWHAICPRHGKFTYPTRPQAEEVARAHADEEERELEVTVPEEEVEEAREARKLPQREPLEPIPEPTAGPGHRFRGERG